MIIVFGSINMDLIVPVGKFPIAGETVIGGEYEMVPGGKGANQALAAARSGVKVALVGCVGDDGMGMRMLNGLRRDGVTTSGVGQSEKPTGMALILLDAAGENQIVISAGANGDAKADQIPDEILLPSNMLLVQGETPAHENWLILSRAKKRGVRTIMNLAPSIELHQSALANIDYLVVNEAETRQLAKMLKIDLSKNASLLAQALVKQGGNLTAILTMGAQGSLAVTPEGTLIRVPALKIERVVDTNGAGDAYCGTLAAALYARKRLPEAMKMASVAGSLACTKRGSQESFAYNAKIEENLASLDEIDISKISF